MAGASRSGSLLRDPAISRLELPWPLAGRCRGGDLLYARAGWFSASMATETDLDLDRQGRRRRDACRAGQALPFEGGRAQGRSEEHTSELQSLMRISYAVFCLKKKNKKKSHPNNINR